MSDKNKKDLSLSDINIKIDLDMEKETKNQPKTDVFKKKVKMEDTLDFYNDDMPRDQVEKLFKAHEKKKEHIDAKREKELAKEEMASTGEVLLKSDMDYEYMLSLLGEPQKEEHIEAEKTAKAPRRAAKTEESKKQTARTYSAIRTILIVVIILFLSGFTGLIIRIASLEKDLANANEEIAKFISNSDDQEMLKMQRDEFEREVYSLRSENENLKSQLNLTEGDTGVSDSQINTETNAESSEPEKYIVQRGDALWKISAKFYNDGNLYEKIMEANNLKSASDIAPGMELIIPNLN